MARLSIEIIQSILGDSRLHLNDPLPKKAIQGSLDYCELLHKWNQKINLVSEDDPKEYLEKHIFDSLQYLPWIADSCKIVDIGSGAGFPGIPIKLILPGLVLTLVESQKKRCGFLRNAVRALKLDGVEVLEGRAEVVSKEPEYSEQFDRALFRGFGSIDECISQGLPFLKVGGQIIMRKGVQEEFTTGKTLCDSARLVHSQEVTGFRGSLSKIIVIEKCST